MRRGAWFINTARGELIDETALLTALRSKWLSGAALDVFAAENSSCVKENPLVAYARGHTNLIITPHIGGCTMESMKKTETFMAKKLCAYWDEVRFDRPQHVRRARLAYPAHHGSPRARW
jgi:D-3-phosphoglycerate dehydrogenase